MGKFTWSSLFGITPEVEKPIASEVILAEYVSAITAKASKNLPRIVGDYQDGGGTLSDEAQEESFSTVI